VNGQKGLHSGLRSRDPHQPGYLYRGGRQTSYRWRKEYDGLRMQRARKLKNPERGKARLKKLVADLTRENAILKEAAEGNF
jgi:hypothetical protein